jgi:hypothetical protein
VFCDGDFLTIHVARAVTFFFNCRHFPHDSRFKSLELRIVTFLCLFPRIDSKRKRIMWKGLLPRWRG